MIVVDASVFIDLLFEYNSDRTQYAEELFSSLEEKGLTILEPDLFKVELIGQIARRMKRDEAVKICGDLSRAGLHQYSQGLRRGTICCPGDRVKGSRLVLHCCGKN